MLLLLQTLRAKMSIIFVESVSSFFFLFHLKSVSYLMYNMKSEYTAWYSSYIILVHTSELSSARTIYL